QERRPVPRSASVPGTVWNFVLPRNEASPARLGLWNAQAMPFSYFQSAACPLRPFPRRAGPAPVLAGLLLGSHTTAPAILFPAAAGRFRHLSWPDRFAVARFLREIHR